MLSGHLRELRQKFTDPIQYDIVAGDSSQSLNELIGAELTIRFTGTKCCIACGRKVNKLFQNGYCFPCVRALAECDLCIVKPHECHFANGTCRDPSFGLHQCMIPHFVYIAWSSGYKVGLTRKGRQFKRWMDQGATEAMVIAEVPTRRTAGELEVEIAQFMNDKTDWRKMLRGDSRPERAIEDVFRDVVERINPTFSDYILSGPQEVKRFQYPRLKGLEVNLKSMNLDKQPIITDTLKGIKGQYLLFDTGVLNVRKFSGYHVELECSG